MTKKKQQQQQQQQKTDRLAINFKTKSLLRTFVIIINGIVNRPGSSFLERPGKITFRARRQILITELVQKLHIS